MKVGGIGLAVVVLVLVLAVPASAAGLLSQPVVVTSAVDKSCTSGERSGAGVARTTFTMPTAGWVTTGLTAASGDWDLAIIDKADNRVVAGSAYAGSDELASGLAVQGSDLVIQACRRSGGSSTATLSIGTTAVDTSTPATKSQLVRVATANLERKNQLADLGLDLTEHGGPGFVEAVLYGAADTQKLVDNNFSYTVEVQDMAAQARRDRAADAQFAAANATSDLPSGRTSYRRLFDYSEDMKALVAANPGLVRPITLNHETYEGRPVEGIEIATNVDARDGRPVFTQLGVHHAREWPSGEHAIEWAYELVNGYRNGDARVQNLVSSTRTIVIPIVNPDGFNTSREAGELLGHGAGHDTDYIEDGEVTDAEFLLAGHSSPNEYRRKNCRFPAGPAAGSCAGLDTGLFGHGVDPNRNYGAFWGGGGSSDIFLEQDYRGPEPFSEPESRNIRELISGRQVTTLITNHTFSNLVLRPPGTAAQGTTVDEPIYKALGDSMAAENGYSSQYGYQLYDTDGTTEDWSYNATGGLGFTFEIGDLGFHPPFAETVGEWTGNTDDATGGGNREAYYKAQQNTADPTKHSVLAGQAPSGSVLRLTKTFDMPTSVEGLTVPDKLDSTMVVSDKKGRFEWHVNPSTRPLVAKSEGEEIPGDPSPPQQFSGGPSNDASPCPAYFELPDTRDPTCWNDHAFEVPADGGGINNEYAHVEITWATPASDWDLEIYRDSNGDGSSENEGEPVADSTSGQTTSERATLGPDVEPGRYVARVINYASTEPYEGTVTFQAPDPFEPGLQESYTLSCETPQGVVKAERQVYVARGERLALDFRKTCRR
jgi:hypothetical protein